MPKIGLPTDPIQIPYVSPPPSVCVFVRVPSMLMNIPGVNRRVSISKRCRRVTSFFFPIPKGTYTHTTEVKCLSSSPCSNIVSACHRRLVYSGFPLKLSFFSLSMRLAFSRRSSSDVITIKREDHKKQREREAR